ncbi:MAG: alanine--tRNA ligase [Oscillospiraceae bacterium]|nr:alanine--tRNA ligase [Oscillospiraceae bacterium]
MEWTGLNELREKYLSFFESKGHLRLPSFSLVPKDDKSLLLINSGMAPMKKYFTGEVTPPRTRVTTCQKCIRTPDIERVGITARHGTFFEMLGNFSFGDYFKHEATKWAWEFCTEVLELPVDKLWVTIYLDDDEAFDIWTKEVGVSPNRIVRMGKEDNFWEHGAGPCGPCSEIYFDRGEEHGCGSPTCGVGCECDRYVEFWNLVFTQFSNDGQNNYTPLEHPNIDTGMGLERLACIMQGVDNLFLVDTVQKILQHVCKIAGVTYGEDHKKDVSIRVITDHIRSTTFMIGDGVMPSNEGRGYVLRRLLRRASRHGRLLGINRQFLSEVAETVIQENKGAYPELEEKRAMILKLIDVEEENFNRTIDQGLSLLTDIADKAETSVFSGAEAFRLNDTYGFPLDLTKEILAERGMTVNEEEFEALMMAQKARARAARKNAGAEAWEGEDDALSDLSETVFTGYGTMEDTGKVLAIVKEGKRVDSASAGDQVAIVLDRTPFYGEGGGQVGDVGKMTSETCVAEIEDTVKNNAKTFIHHAEIKEGVLAVGDTVKATVNKRLRMATMRNHTGAHLLQAALREVLGEHVEQAGQLVSPTSIRFDFTHFSAMTPEEIKLVEKRVNEVIFDALPVISQEMPIEEAKKIGAMALFGEKYGNIVRVVTAGEFSKEFCGGTHVDNTAKLGLFKIVTESSVAAGVRRIEAVTGQGVLNMLNTATDMIHGAAAVMKLGNSNELVDKVSHILMEMKDKDKTIAKLNEKMAMQETLNIFDKAHEVKGTKIVSVLLTGTSSDMLKTMCDKFKDLAPNVIAVLAGTHDGKATIAAACGKEAVKLGAHAGNIVRKVAQIAGGNGGGKPDMAMAGAKDLTKLDEALAAVDGIVTELLK